MSTCRRARVFLSLTMIGVLTLSGCSVNKPNDKAIAVYDFGADKTGDDQAVPAVPNADRRLTGRLALEVRAVTWLDNPGIDYRLTYSTPLRRSQYVDSRWAAPPAQLLAQQLRRRTGLVAVDRMAVDCLLRIELREFSQVFTSPQTSHGVLSGQAELIDGQRRLIVSRPIDVEHPAPAPDAAGGVQALVATGSELGGQLIAWLDQLDRQGALKACRPVR